MSTERRDALIRRLFETSIGAMELGSVDLGLRLGLFEALARLGGATNEAGFTHVATLPIENDVFRFYLLRP